MKEFSIFDAVTECAWMASAMSAEADGFEMMMGEGDNSAACAAEQILNLHSNNLLRLSQFILHAMDNLPEDVKEHLTKSVTEL